MEKQSRAILELVEENESLRKQSAAAKYSKDCLGLAIELAEEGSIKESSILKKAGEFENTGRSIDDLREIHRLTRSPHGMSGVVQASTEKTSSAKSGNGSPQSEDLWADLRHPLA